MSVTTVCVYLVQTSFNRVHELSVGISNSNCCTPLKFEFNENESKEIPRFVVCDAKTLTKDKAGQARFVPLQLQPHITIACTNSSRILNDALFS